MTDPTLTAKSTTALVSRLTQLEAAARHARQHELASLNEEYNAIRAELNSRPTDQLLATL